MPRVVISISKVLPIRGVQIHDNNFVLVSVFYNICFLVNIQLYNLCSINPIIATVFGIVCFGHLNSGFAIDSQQGL